MSSEDMHTPERGSPAGESHEVLTGLALLGIDDSFPALNALQEMISPDHYQKAATPETSPARSDTERTVETTKGEGEASPGADVVRNDNENGPPAADAAGALDSSAVSTSEVVVHASPSPHRSPPRSVQRSPARNLFDVGAGDPFKDASGAAIRDDDLHMLFHTYDLDGNGWISREEFKKEYRNFESFGLEMTDRELDQLFTRYDKSSHRGGKPDGKLTFDEFALLMLYRSRL